MVSCQSGWSLFILEGEFKKKKGARVEQTSGWGRCHQPGRGIMCTSSPLWHHKEVIYTWVEVTEGKRRTRIDGTVKSALCFSKKKVNLLKCPIGWYQNLQILTIQKVLSTTQMSPQTLLWQKQKGLLSQLIITIFLFSISRCLLLFNITRLTFSIHPQLPTSSSMTESFSNQAKSKQKNLHRFKETRCMWRTLLV